MNEQYKSGFAALIGRPNVGKSTLMNHLIGQKIAITSKKPQTTRNRIQTVYTCEEGQIVFLDTPGIHKAKNKLGEYMVNVAERTLKEVDVILWLVEPTTFIGAGERHIAEQLEKISTPVILIINKIDTVKKEEILEFIDTYRKLYDFDEIIPCSALRGINTEDIISCIQNGACGILSFLDVTDEAIDYCEQNKVPLFLCGFKPRRERVCAIYSDAYQCAKLVAQEAVSCGAKRPCYVGYGKGALNEDRKEGFIATLRSNELSCDIYSFSYYSREQSLEKLKKSVRENENDFVFCFNDEIAASVQETMESVENFRGEIYGVDRFSEYLPYCRKVKSVGGRLSVIGRRTAQLLIRKIEKYDGKIVREIFPVELSK